MHFLKVWLFIGLMLVASVIYLSLTASYPAYLVMGDDIKLNHILAYAVLMLYFAELIASPRMAWPIAALFLTMGIVLEYLQGQTGYRTFSYYDMLADGLGISFGFLASRSLLVNFLAYVDQRMAEFF